LPTELEKCSASYRVLAQRLLGRAPGFDQCPKATINKLLALAELARVKKNEMVVRRGAPCEHLIMLVEGALEASIQGGSGRRHLLTFIPPGMMVGLLPCIDDGPMVHDILARIPSVVLKMPADVVRRQRAATPSLHIAFDVQLAWRTRNLYDMVAEQLLHSLRERLSQHLVQLVTSFGLRRGKKWEIALRLPQADLAELLGITRQSVNTELRELEKTEVICIRHSHIDVLDLAALRARCGRLVVNN